MMSPKKMKFRRAHRSKLKGMAKRGTTLGGGDFGLVAVENGRITARQIEAARVAMTRHIKRGGQVWIKVFPHFPVSKKPAEVRMGGGKGGIDHYEARVKAGRILYEMEGVDPTTAVEALALAAAKLPIRTKLLNRHTDPWG
jgi:large subunit ribosomal protein L16